MQEEQALFSEAFPCNSYPFLERIEELKERMKDSEHGADARLELSETAFNFACHAKYWFENGNLEEKNRILQTIGSNFILKDAKLFIELKNPWLIIKRGLENERKEKRGLELLQSLDSPEFGPSLCLVGPTWHPGGDSNPQPTA